MGVHVIYAKYNTSFTLPFALLNLTGDALQKSAVHAAGDTILMKDEGVEANTTNGFVDEGSGYSITLTATEMQAARLLLMIEDQTAPKVWLTRTFEIFTFGNASAHVAFDLSTAVQDVNVAKLGGDTTAANNQRQAAKGVLTGTAVTGTLTSTAFTTDLPAATDNYYFNKRLVWVSGATLQYQSAHVIRSEATGGKLFVTPMTGSPVNGDPFILV